MTKRSYTDGVCTLPLLPPKGGLKAFLNKIQFQYFNRINFATKFLCVKTSSSKVVL